MRKGCWSRIWSQNDMVQAQRRAIRFGVHDPSQWLLMGYILQRASAKLCFSQLVRMY